jgi:hypothetical protein
VSFVAKGLFARTLVVPLDRVPHPTVFLKLVTACAKKTEVDRPVAGFL